MSLVNFAARITPRHSAILAAGIVVAAVGHHAVAVHAADAVPNLVGTWSGDNNTYSDKKGYKTWAKTIVVTEQKDRLFKGHFTYSAGTKNFFGVVYPDNVSITWVAVDSKGYNHGRIHGADKISACYVESWEEATVGCAEMTKQPDKK